MGFEGYEEIELVSKAIEEQNSLWKRRMDSGMCTWIWKNDRKSGTNPNVDEHSISRKPRLVGLLETSTMESKNKAFKVVACSRKIWSFVLSQLLCDLTVHLEKNEEPM